jgi:sulfate permease, SulP family
MLTSVTAGTVIAVVEVVFACSFAALIFRGPLSARLADGIGLYIGAAVVLMGLLAWTTGGRGSVGSVQDGPAAVLAVVAASISIDVVAGSDTVFLSAIAAMVVATLLTGIGFLLLGTFRLGNVVRFVPYPVVGGFLAGTGWLLAIGGVSVASGIPVTQRTLDDLVTGNALRQWLPALAFGVAMYMAVRLVRRPLVIPAALVAGLVLFAIGMAVTGSSIGDAEAGGWLLGPFPEAGLWEPWAWRTIGGADWSAVLRQAGGIATAVFVGVVAILLNVTGIELMLRRDLDSNQELRSAGVANVVAALAGGIPGFHAPSLTSLALRTHAPARITGVAASVVALATLLFGVSLVALIPRMLLGGILLFLGISFLVEWVVDARREMPLGEYSLILAILLAIAAKGLLAGVAVGLVLAVVLFAVSYSRAQLVREGVLGAAFHSNVERPPGEREALVTRGERVSILRLHGFVFFGTASGVLDRVRERVGTDHPLRFLVIDFRRVTGVDSSAALSFRKAAQLGDANGFEVILTAVPPDVRARLERAGVGTDGARVQFDTDLDRGLERCEDALLDPEAGGDRDVWGAAYSEGQTGERPLSERLRPYLERLEVGQGTVLIRQGEPPEDVYVLESGRLRVDMQVGGETHRLRTMRAGVVVGEVALYTRQRRIADVVAEVPSTVLRLSRSSLERMEREEPDLAIDVHRWFATVLAGRLGYSLEGLATLDD